MDYFDEKAAATHLIETAGEIVTIEGEGRNVFIEADENARQFGEPGGRVNLGTITIIGLIDDYEEIKGVGRLKGGESIQYRGEQFRVNQSENMSGIAYLVAQHESTA